MKVHVVMRDCSLVLNVSLANSPSPRAVRVSGRLKASGDDGHVLSLEVGIRVGPHIGVICISDIIAGIQM